MSISECETAEEGGNENLEEIVSHLLQHNLHLQQLLLSKQRRGIVIRKKIAPGLTSCETSDTETDDLASRRLAANSELSLTNDKSRSAEDYGSNSVLDDIGVSDAGVMQESVNLYFNKERERLADFQKCGVGTNNSAQSEGGSGSECPSVCGSQASIDSNTKEILNKSSHSMLDFSRRRRCSSKKSFSESTRSPGIWSSLRGLSHRKDTCHGSTPFRSDAYSLEPSSRHISLRRVHSFNSEISGDPINQDNMSVKSIAYHPIADNGPDNKDRPVTIAVYETNEENENDKLEDCLTNIINKNNYNNTQKKCSSENLQIHPDHKIYTKSNLSKQSLKNVIAKLTTTRKSLIQPPPCDNLSDTGKIADKTPSKLVYTMAKHCTKSLKERIKQIRSEDEVSTTNVTVVTNTDNQNCNKSNNNSQIYDLPEYQQGSTSIGAKLASNSENVLRNNLDSINENDFSQSSANEAPSAPNDETFNNDVNLDDSCGSLEDFQLENDPDGDSYYERSFEVIEDMLETDLFRDSAIYSDPEDADGKMHPVDLKHFPKSVLNRVSKSPSLRSDKYNITGPNGVVKKKSVSESESLSFTENGDSHLRKSTSQSSETVIQLDLSSSQLHDIQYADAYSLDECGIVEQNLNKSVGNLSCSVSNYDNLEVSDSSEIFDENSVKIPPPVPAKPENKRIVPSKNCGDKILQQLKILEESSKYSKSDSMDSSLEGLKSISQRRQELRSCNSALEKLARHQSQKVTSKSSIKPPRSPLLAVRSFMGRNVGSVTRRKLCRSSESTSSINSVGKKSEDDLTNSSQISRRRSITGIVNNKSESRGTYQSISITRKKSIKSIRNYVNKMNSRSSSVPPQPRERLEHRQSSLPTNSVPSRSGSECSGTGSSDSSLDSKSNSVPSSKSYPESISDKDNSSSDETGVVIERKRPKGWVRHVVGRLQQGDKSSTPVQS